MSEKRFVAEQVDVVNEDETEVWDIVFDTENTYAFMVRDTDTASDLCDLLNEQQATNDYLEESNSRLQVQLGETLRLVDKLKEENEQLKKELKWKREEIKALIEESERDE